MREVLAIILAAGKSTRMYSTFSKVLHKIYGKSMLEYVLEDIRAIGIRRGLVIINNQNGISKKITLPKGFRSVFPKRLLGTGHALRQAESAISNFNGDILVLYGDTPLVTMETLGKLIEKHRISNAACTLLTTTMKDPFGYGRIVRDDKSDIIRIVEEADASLYEKMIDEVNVGVYCFKARDVFRVLAYLKPKGPKGELYLTDAVELLAKRKAKIDSIHTEDVSEAIGVNSRVDLAKAQALAKDRILTRLMKEGIGIIDPSTTHIYNDVKIGQDTVIYPFTVIESNVRIGKKCRIGPFSRIRPDTILEDEVEIGNFVEIVRCKIGSGTVIKHHCYLGDAEIGKGVNIGAGTITVNYDGKNKHKTKIGERSFIGSGTILMAPILIGKRTTTGAGSVVLKNSKVPAGSVLVGVPAKILKKSRR
ncbi:MAG: NTP transferase domain-containing protein [Candidatus Omnitrophica bacterium]|nr:NTP transferase domain-containing protein [Candidatus Omnitrophota bacterium]